MVQSARVLMMHLRTSAPVSVADLGIQSDVGPKAQFSHGRHAAGRTTHVSVVSLPRARDFLAAVRHPSSLFRRRERKTYRYFSGSDVSVALLRFNYSILENIDQSCHCQTSTKNGAFLNRARSARNDIVFVSQLSVAVLPRKVSASVVHAI